jgi:hypothetical protein
VTLLVAVSDMQDLPAVSKVALLDVFGESECSVTIDGDIYGHALV